MFKIVAVVFIGILTGIGFFDLRQEAYTLAALCSVPSSTAAEKPRDDGCV